MVVEGGRGKGGERDGRTEYHVHDDRKNLKVTAIGKAEEMLVRRHLLSREVPVFQGFFFGYGRRGMYL
jgi:hypothetical protein